MHILSINAQKYTAKRTEIHSEAKIREVKPESIRVSAARRAADPGKPARAPWTLQGIKMIQRHPSRGSVLVSNTNCIASVTNDIAPL